MPIENIDSGEILMDTEAQEMVRKAIEKCGRLIISSSTHRPEVGEIIYWVGLPFRVVRHSTLAEARKDQALTPEWGEVDPPTSLDFYFEIEVAD